MSRSVESNRRASRRLAPAGIIFSVLGILLFAYFVRKAGVDEILEGIRRLGAGFLLILLVSGVRPLVRALAWKLCVEAPYHMRLRDAFRAYMIGDAVGTLLPMGFVAGEPAKAVLVRDRVPLVAGLSALAVEYLFYSLSAAALISAGTVALLLSFDLSYSLRWVSIGVLAGVFVITFVSFIVLRRQWKFASRLLERLHRRGVGRGVIDQRRRERVSALEDRVYGFYARNRTHFIPILLLESCFHLAGVLEVYITLSFISDVPPTWLTAFVLESVNRVINVVFKFVPLRVGVDEAGTGMLTRALQLGTASGVTLAIIRKARVVAWTAVGVAFLVGRGLTLGAVAVEAERAIERERAEEGEPGADEPAAVSAEAGNVKGRPLSL